jgi:hypothetical protein
MRDRYWQEFKASESQTKWVKYKNARNYCVLLQKRAKANFKLKLARNSRSCPKKFFAYMQTKRTLRETVGCLANVDGSLSQTDWEKAETLVKHFQSVHRIDYGTTVRVSRNGGNSETDMTNLELSNADVRTALQQLKLRKSPGPDGIYPDIVKPLAGIIDQAVCDLFNESRITGRIPCDWKSATVVAIYKGGQRSKASNYRPVSLTSVLCKCLERLVRNHICKHLVTNNLLSAAQHGFLKGRSCLTNLLFFLDEITRRLEEGRQVEVCYLDFSKAFDSVCHRLLIQKLRWFGLSAILINWVEDFLKSRYFSVRVGEYLSLPVPATSGVPKGSVLGPLLFIMYIDDLVRNLKNPCFAFADDVKIVSSSSRISLLDDIQRVLDWSVCWDLPINHEKCNLLTRQSEPLSVSIDQQLTTIKSVDLVRDLGTMVAADFKPAEQCLHAAKTARRELFRLRAALSCRRPEVFLPLYKALVRPHLEYCVQAWAPYYSKDINCL